MSTTRLARCAVRSILATTMAVLAGCSVMPERPYMHAPHAAAHCKTTVPADAVRITPEAPADQAYTLHFIEFDDQGWLFPDGTDTDHPEGKPTRQIDCAIADIAGKLKPQPGQPQPQVLSFVYVHGWKHSADTDDRDVKRFRKLLQTRAALFPGRKIVGIYVGWQGKTMDLPVAKELTFWGRKNAASHVADGRLRELFSRIKGLRDHWNGPAAGVNRTEDCDWTPSAKDQCALRTIMIGHSFGGLILYSSVAPYVLETLSATRDIPPAPERAKSKRARGIADLIVLLNPAFEGGRYEPVFAASQHYAPVGAEPPLLVLLTSTADWATKNAFPIARWFNSIFQYPASSDRESQAMRRTPGHIDHYLTHELCLQGKPCDGANPEAEPASRWQDPRRLCGGLVLGRYPRAASGDRSIVWNIRTHKDIIADHDAIDGEAVFSFVQQLYGRVDGTGAGSCKDAEDLIPASVVRAP
jgi:hypothetical protein